MKTKQKINTAGMLFYPLVVFSLAALFIPTPRHITEVKHRVVEILHPPRSKEEMVAFFKTNLNALYPEALQKHQFRIPKVQARFDMLQQKIFRLHNTNYLYFSLLKGYSHAGKDITRGATVGSNGVPTVNVYIPAVMDIHTFLRQSGASAEEFELDPIIGTMHELDHLARGNRYNVGKDSPYEDSVREEKETWAETCEYTLRPLVETYHAHLPIGYAIYYINWVEAGRDVNSSKWEKFIHDYYKSTKK